MQEKSKATLKVESWLIHTQHSSGPMKLITLREVAESQETLSGWQCENILKEVYFFRNVLFVRVEQNSLREQNKTLVIFFLFHAKT